MHFPQLLCSREFWREYAGRGLSAASSPVLAGPSVVLGPCVPPQRLSTGDSDQEGSPLSGGGALSFTPTRSYGNCGRGP